jgi:hypothetical protein
MPFETVSNGGVFPASPSERRVALGREGAVVAGPIDGGRERLLLSPSWSPVLRGARKPEGRIHHGHVAKCLWKVSKLALDDRIVLFGQQPDIVSETEQTVEQFFRFLEAALEDEVIYKPKAAREKGAFTGWKTINPRLGFVAQNKSVDQKPAFNLGDRIANAIITGRQETDQR